MTERTPLGEVLERCGRISVADRERALAHQKEHGGYFGEALVALGLLTQEELDYSLATQFDLPYVFPDPGSIDLDAARMVAPEWALAHRMLPIARSGDTLSVVVDTPFRTEALAELAVRTGLEVEMAMTAGERIRELILHVFGAEGQGLSALSPAQNLDDFLDQVLASGAPRFGLSLRGRRVLGWWEASGRVHRCLIPSGWPGALARRLHPGVAPGGPPPPEEAPPAAAEWTQAERELSWGGTRIPLTHRHLRTPVGEELVFDLQGPEPSALEVDPPPAALIEEVRLLERAGAARFLVQIHPPSLTDHLLPHLPELLLGPQVRTVHVGECTELPGILRLPIPEPSPDGEAPAGAPGFPQVAQLRALRFDALTARIPSEVSAALLPRLARGAGAVFLVVDRGRRGRESADRSPAGGASARSGGEPADPALGWRLRIQREEGGRLAWSLLPAASGAAALTPPTPQLPPS